MSVVDSVTGEMGGGLEKLSSAERMLAEIVTEQDALHVIDFAEAARVFAKRVGLGTAAANHAQRVKLHAERRLADIVDEGQAAGRIATQGKPPEAGGFVTLDELGIKQQRLSEARAIRDAFTDEDLASLAEEATDRDEDLTRAGLLKRCRGALPGNNSGDNEWYTPSEYIEAARAVMGGIDLDPASSDTANETVQAATFYTEDDNGLAREWKGRVWMNPPYAQPACTQFAEKLATSFFEGQVETAVVLVNNATETGWFNAMIEMASAVCFPKGRVRFWHPRKQAVPLQGQAIIYLGDSPERFRAEFAKFGWTAHL